MKKMIRQEKNDNGFTRPLTVEEWREMRKTNKRNDKKQQELSKDRKKDIALTNIQDKRSRDIEEMIANNYGFNNIKVYELYRDEMRSKHDIYRKPPKSEQWLHNSLFEAEFDTVQTEGYISKRQFFAPNLWLKKIGYMELRNMRRDYKAVEFDIWRNDQMFLPDGFTRHNSSDMTPCKSLEFQASIFSDIKTKKLWELKIKIYALSGQYFMTCYEKCLELETYTQKEIMYNAERMKPKSLNAFQKCHISSRS